MRRIALIAAVALLDALVLLRLAGSVTGAVMFVGFVAFLLVPSIALASRLPPLRAMPAEWRLTVASLIVIVSAVPWFFLRKAIGATAAFDGISIVALTFAAVRSSSLRQLVVDSRPALRRTCILLLVVLPILFAITSLGWNAPAGNEVREYGLFAIDFGNLVSVVSTLRASPSLPLAFVDGSGAFSYHWLYFTLPATLADFAGSSMPNANALLVTNLLAAMLLVHAVASVAEDWRAAAIVLFGPFTTYFYQAASTRLPLGPLAMPAMRNYLLLSPVNSMLVFGNNTVALVLALVTLVQLERWNREGRLSDAILGVLALALMIGYSITLVFPLVLTLLVWVLMGRVRRPVLALALAVVCGACVVAVLVALHVLGGNSSRHLGVAFDRGQWIRMLAFGLLPLWGVALLGARRGLTIFHVLMASCIAIPSFLFVAGSPTGTTDFSMKTASLLALSFAPLLALGSLSAGRAVVAVLLVSLGVVQTSAYVLQFPFYRLRHSTSNGVGLPRDYVAALAWVRDHTPRPAIVVDPQSLTARDELFTLMLGERRAWLPTPYTNEVSIVTPPPGIAQRVVLWRAFSERGDQLAGAAIAREADVIVTPVPLSSPAWQPVHREGAWTVYRSTLHGAR